MDTRYYRNAGAVYSLQYHIVWCPKYRRKVLTNDVAVTMETLLYEKAEQLGITIEALEIMPDHVHLFISSDPTEAPQRIVNQFKGYTSRKLREIHPHLKSRLPCMWSRSYYIGSVGHVSEKTVKAYIESQKGK